MPKMSKRKTLFLPVQDGDVYLREFYGGVRKIHPGKVYRYSQFFGPYYVSIKIRRNWTIQSITYQYTIPRSQIIVASARFVAVEHPSGGKQVLNMATKAEIT